MALRRDRLQSRTFRGKRLSHKQIADICETVRLFPNLSRMELCHTVCEQLDWKTPNGDNRVLLARRVLEDMEEHGHLKLPALRNASPRGRQRPLKITSRTDPQPAIEADLADLTPLTLQPVTKRKEIGECNEWIQRYHPLGYKHPMGPNLRYFLFDRQGRKLGCMLFAFAALQVACRDKWIGWEYRRHREHLDLVLGNTRFLVFPWVRVKCLASKVLGMVVRRLPEDWQRRHGTRPVLVETFVDLEKHKGTCYRAANWQYLGMTTGSFAKGRVQVRKPKGVFVYPLQPSWRKVLLDGPRTPGNRRKPKPRPKARRKPKAKPRRGARPRRRAKEDPRKTPDSDFAPLLQGVVGTLERISSEYDSQWIKRQRVLNTLLVVLFVFRLVFKRDHRGYTVTMAELWEQCRRLGVALAQPKPVSASSMTVARSKIRQSMFKRLHRAILDEARPHAAERPWLGHRVFTVRSLELNLPRRLAEDGYPRTSANGKHRLGLLSCIYQLGPQVPFDCELVSHGEKGRAALTHLSALEAGDVVVYDAGHYCFRLLHAHIAHRVPAVFPLEGTKNSLFTEFIRSDRSQALVTVEPSARAWRQQPQAKFWPCRVRLVKFSVGKSTHALATTLLDPRRYPADALAKLCLGRTSVEQLHKVSEQMLKVEHFHGRTERTVMQEIVGHFSLLAISRLFPNRSQSETSR